MDVRLANTSDALRCNAFYNVHYGRARSEVQWCWEFVARSPNGPLPFSMAVDANEVVGTQALIPIPCVDERGVFLTAKSEETLIAERVRGRDLLAKLYTPLFEWAAERKVWSIWGFTPAVKAFRRIGFEVPLTTRQLYLPLEVKCLIRAAGGGGERLAGYRRVGLALLGACWMAWAKLCGVIQRVIGPGLATGETMRTLESEGPFSDDFTCEFIRRWGGTTILRSREFMKWRIFDNPHRRATVVAVLADGTLAGFVAFAIGHDRAGYLIDLMVVHPRGSAEDRRVVQVLLNECVRRLERMGATCARGWTVTNHRFDALVRRMAVRRGFAVINRGNPAVFTINVTPALRGTSHDDFRNWYVTRIFTEGVLG